MRAFGPSGALRVGYQWAADLGAWELVPDQERPHAYVLRARITRSHDFWLEQGPLDLVLALGTTEWLWRGVDVLQGDGQAVSVILTERPIVSARSEIASTATTMQRKRGWM